MKKITLLLLLGFLWSWANYAQVPIGEQSGVTSNVPINGLYDYSYSQQIIYQSEINANGDITSLSVYFASGSNTVPNDNWTIYMGHTAKTGFTSTTDWVPSGSLSPVFTGTVVFPAPGNWMTVTFTTPFAYNGTDNLIVAVLENKAGYASLSFGKTTDYAGSNRAIYTSRDGTAIDPTSPPTAKARYNYINNMILGGIQQSCPFPNQVGLTDLTVNTASLEWTENGSATEWQVIYGATGFDPSSEGTALTANNTAEITISGLTDNTGYDVYVKSICGPGDESSLTGPLSFTTLCLPTTIPYVMDFETATVPNLPSCTSRENVGTGNNWVTATYTSGGFTGKVLKYGYNSSNPANAWFYTQGVELVAGTAYQISYLYGNNSSTYHESMKVAYGTSPLSTAMTNPLADYPDITGTNNATVGEVSFTVAADGVYYFGFNAYSAANLLNLYVDNINVDLAPSCPTPTALATTGVTDNSADVSWNPGLNETEWEVVYGLTNFDPETEGDTVNVSDDPETTLVGLQPDTTYQYYVRAICGTNDESVLSAVGSFFTGFCQVSSTYTGDYVSSINSTGATSNISYTATTQPAGGYANETGQLFEVAATETIQISTTYVGGTNGVNVWVDWNKNMVFDDSEKVSSSVNSDPKTLSITVPAGTPGGEYRMRVRGQYNALPPACGEITFGSAVDFKLTVLAPQDCLSPTDLMVSGVAGNSADLSWTAGGNETQWEVLYGITGFDPVTQGTSVTANTDPEITITGLVGTTEYDFYVTAICGVGNESPMAGPVSFTTTCGAGIIPFTEGFESGNTDGVALGGCWSQSSGNWIVNQGNKSNGREARTGDWYVSMQYNNTGWIFYPIELNAGTSYELKFYAMQDASTGANVQASYGTADNAAAMTNNIVPSSPVVNGGYQEFSGYFMPSASGTYYLGIKADLNFAPWYLNLDDISVTEATGCLPPGSLTASNLTDSSADISWTPVSTETEWEVLYGLAGFDPSTEGTTVTVNTNPEMTIPGLAANTGYDFYVTAICGAGEESNRVGPVGFRTLCSSTSIPYVMDFETAVIPNLPECTTRENAGAGNNWVTATYTLGGFTGKVLKYGYASNPANAWFFTQGIELVAGTAYQISYMYGNNSAGYTEKMKVAYGTSPESTAMVNQLADYPNITGLNNATVAAISFTVAADGIYYFGFNAYSDANLLNLYLDNINVDLAPSCPAPTSPVVTGVTDSSADVAWTPGLSETEWEVVYGLANFDPQTEGDTVSASGDPETTITGLQADTVYEFYVRAICGAGDESLLSPVGSFFTGYCQVSSTYTSDYLSSINSSGAISNISYTASSQPTGGYADETTQIFEAAATETFVISTTYVGGTNGVNVWVDWNGNMEFDDSEKVSSPVNSSTKTLSITVPAGTPMGDYRMRVRAQYNGLPPACGNITFGSAVDFKLTVMAPPACPAPTALMVTGVAENSADISWTAGATETEWKVLYGLTGFNPATEGTEVNVNTDPDTTITGLNASTTYDVYVKAVCGAGNESVWVGPVSFDTLCTSLEMPWSEGFESGTALSPIVPNLACWSEELVSGQDNWKFVTTNESNTVTPHGGSLMAEYRAATFALPASKLITPSMNLTSLTSAQLTFYFANASWGTDVDELRVYYKHSASDATWTLIDGAVYTTVHENWEKVELILPEASGATDYVIAFEATSQYARGLDLDDVSIGEASAGCSAPTALAATNVTENSADLSWTAGGTETEWKVLYGVAGFDPVTQGTEVIVNTDPETTIAGLDGNTGYDFYVTAVCGVGSESDRVGPMSFTTHCASTTVPYMMDFETAVVPNIPECTSKENVGNGNDWVTQVYNLNGMSGNVLRYGYNSNNAANAWFYTQGIELQTGVDYEISYKYYGSANFPEKMKVAYGTSPQSTEMTQQLADYPSIGGAGDETVAFTVTADGVYYFGFNVYSDADQNYLYVDDISIVEVGSTACDPVTNVLVTDITENGATVSWTASATATEGYVVNVYLEGADPNTATPEATETVGAGITTVAITGLVLDTAYDVYVISDCGNGNTAVSDVVKFTTLTIGIDDNNLAQVSYFPNPVKGQLTINAARTIENVTVYNLLGQPVLQVQPRGMNVVLDMSSLPTGTYVLKANVADAVSTFKVIKE